MYDTDNYRFSVWIFKCLIVSLTSSFSEDRLLGDGARVCILKSKSTARVKPGVVFPILKVAAIHVVAGSFNSLYDFFIHSLQNSDRAINGKNEFQILQHFSCVAAIEIKLQKEKATANTVQID